MKKGSRLALRARTVGELAIADERSFRQVEIYGELKEILRRDRYRFRLLPEGRARWDRALLLNLTFWGGAGGDVLDAEPLSADVVMHAAWHHLATNALGTGANGRPSIEALFLGESIASAFDLYLVGRLLGRAQPSSFLETQVPAMQEAASAAGLSKGGFRKLLSGVAAAPERAFGELQALLFDVALALAACADAEEGLSVLVRFEGHPFSPLLHHYELSNWVLFAWAQGRRGKRSDRRVREVQRALSATETPLGWLAANWVAPALGRGRYGGTRRLGERLRA